MRSELVHAASQTVNNRFLLCRLVSLSTRNLHPPNNSFNDTINDVLRRVMNKTPESLVRPPSVIEELPHSEPPILIAGVDVAGI